MRKRTWMGLGLLVAMLAGATVWAQRPGPSLPDGSPAAPPARRMLTFEDLRPSLEQIIRERGSLEVKHSGAIDVRVRVESIEDLQKAGPILERVFELENVGMGWIDRERELKMEMVEALGKVPDALTVNHELRMRDMERKLDRIIKALDDLNRDRGQ